jgi:hypothetical protein
MSVLAALTGKKTTAVLGSGPAATRMRGRANV